MIRIAIYVIGSPFLIVGVLAGFVSVCVFAGFRITLDLLSRYDGTIKRERRDP